MNVPRKRVSSDVLKRGYSDEEIAHIYELARFSLENGDIRRAEVIINGLIEIAPDFSPAWLTYCCIQIFYHNYEAALQGAQQAHRVDSQSVVAELFLIACLLTLGDYNTAGTFLGEVAERIEGGALTDPRVRRFYQAQLIRYQNRA